MPPKKKGESKDDGRIPLLGRSTNNVGMGIVGMPNVGKVRVAKDCHRRMFLSPLNALTIFPFISFPSSLPSSTPSVNSTSRRKTTRFAPKVNANPDHHHYEKKNNKTSGSQNKAVLGRHPTIQAPPPPPLQPLTPTLFIYPFPLPQPLSPDPNLAKVPVPDKRFEKLVKAHQPKSVKSAVLAVTDIAGLVRGASTGAGLGNEFLSHIRATDAIFHMVRAFEDTNISHVEESVDPIRDMEIIEGELRAKDLESMVNYCDKEKKQVERGIGGKEKKFEYDVFTKVKELLESGGDVRSVRWSAKETPIINTKQFLTAKPMIYLVNLKRLSYIKKRSNWLPKIMAYVKAKGLGEPVLPISADYETLLVDAELAGPEELAKVVAEHDNVASILPRVIKLGYKTLQMQSFFTCGPDEVRQWSIRNGFTAPEAAGTIHGDFQKHFICAETYSFKDWNKAGATFDAVAAVRAQGKVKTEGKKYVMKDGDICFFKHNANK